METTITKPEENSTLKSLKELLKTEFVLKEKLKSEMNIYFDNIDLSSDIESGIEYYMDRYLDISGDIREYMDYTFDMAGAIQNELDGNSYYSDMIDERVVSMINDALSNENHELHGPIVNKIREVVRNVDNDEYFEQNR